MARNEIGNGTLVLIRHGETKANKEHRYLGKTDESLSDDGKKSLQSYQRQGCYPKVDILFASPMKRCLETAQILYPRLQPVIIPEWEEMDFGQFEYRNAKELGNNEQYQAWIDSGGALPVPGGESREDFIERCVCGWKRMCRLLRPSVGQDVRELRSIAGQNAQNLCLSTRQDVQDLPPTTGIIVHGGTIMALLSVYDGNDYFDYQVPNGKGYLCRIQEWKPHTKMYVTRKL